MKYLHLTIFLLALHLFANAQEKLTGNNMPIHKIVFQLTSGDTVAHKQLMKQFANITSVSPQTQIEIVCHGPGLDMLVKGKSIVESKIQAFSEKGIVFYACEFSMKERKVEADKIIKSVGFVPAGIIEIVSKQEQGWSYIKAGN